MRHPLACARVAASTAIATIVTVAVWRRARKHDEGETT